MIALAALVIGYCCVLTLGKIDRNEHFLSYILIVVVTLFQVLFLILYLYTMDIPEP